jgi:hypothetical protein
VHSGNHRWLQQWATVACPAALPLSSFCLATACLIAPDVLQVAVIFDDADIATLVGKLPDDVASEDEEDSEEEEEEEDE